MYCIQTSFYSTFAITLVLIFWQIESIKVIRHYNKFHGTMTSTSSIHVIMSTHICIQGVYLSSSLFAVLTIILSTYLTQDIVCLISFVYAHTHTHTHTHGLSQTAFPRSIQHAPISMTACSNCLECSATLTWFISLGIKIPSTSLYSL